MWNAKNKKCALPTTSSRISFHLTSGVGSWTIVMRIRLCMPWCNKNSPRHGRSSLCSTTCKCDVHWVNCEISWTNKSHLPTEHIHRLEPVHKFQTKPIHRVWLIPSTTVDMATDQISGFVPVGLSECSVVAYVWVVDVFGIPVWHLYAMDDVDNGQIF